MKFVYGPVPSRRLGQSLGIDPVPLKTCNWNCVYCQLGRTRPVVNERLSYTPVAPILAEIAAALGAPGSERIDWVTFVGSGEPTLHKDIGYLIGRVKGMTDKPVAVITNGSLLYLPQVQAELADADAVLPTLDAGNPELYRRINRPHPEISFQRLVEGLIAFRAVYPGKLWLEIMLLDGLNTSRPALLEIAHLTSRIEPDEVHLNMPVRPPAEPWVQPPGEDQILQAMAILGKRCRVVHPVQGRFVLVDSENILDDILGILTRHPMREAELRAAVAAISPDRVSQVMRDLKGCPGAQLVERYGVRFWSTTPAFYPGLKG